MNVKNWDRGRAIPFLGIPMSIFLNFFLSVLPGFSLIFPDIPHSKYILLPEKKTDLFLYRQQALLTGQVQEECDI